MPKTKPTLDELSRAECLAIRRLGELIGYETRQHRYFQDSRGRWRRAVKRHPLRRSAHNRHQGISDWDLGNQRSLPRYTLTSVEVMEAEARLALSETR